ncbi:MAG: heavy-metal-associated domain-containing protein [gamma proteobacterium symbiont of Bathyaustriella thionipta]|nr:heavy-metal-associated domain-containing protein [gamma proteobacterium symbiont of Bathyaustriella thionipta]
MNSSPVRIKVEGILCGNGMLRVRKILQSLDGVTAVHMDLRTAVLQFEGGTEAQAIKALLDAGVTASPLSAGDQADCSAS